MNAKVKVETNATQAPGEDGLDEALLLSLWVDVRRLEEALAEDVERVKVTVSAMMKRKGLAAP